MDEKLNQIILDWRHRPFVWGASDCCQFVIDASARLTGNSPAIEKYKSEREALRVIKKLGGYGEILKSCGYRLLDSPLLAQRGDVVSWISKTDKNFSSGLGVCGGEHVFAMGKDGLVFIEQGRWLQAWRDA